MSINRILIINQQKKSNTNILTATINLPAQVSDDIIEELVSEFRDKLAQHTSATVKKTFSSINSVSLVELQPLQKTAQIIKSNSEPYQKEVANMKMDQVIEALKVLKVIEDRVINFVTHEKGLVVKNKLQTISVDGEKATINLQNSTITNLDVSDLTYNIHQIVGDNTTFEDFSKRIYYIWERISF